MEGDYVRNCWIHRCAASCTDLIGGLEKAGISRI